MSNNPDITIYDFENICRTCLSPNDLKPLYEKWLESTSLVDMLMSCTVLKFTEDDGLPVKICINCINQITQAFLFAQHCEATDTILRNCVKKINSEFACNSFQSQNIHLKEEIKIKVKPEITHRTVQDVLGDYKVKQEDDMNREFTSEISLPTEEKILDDFQDVKEEVTQEEDLNIEYEETFDDPMVENEDNDHTYSKKSDIPSSRPQIKKISSKHEDSESCDSPANDSNAMDDDDDQDESYSEKSTPGRKVSPDSHPKVYADPRPYDCHVCRKSFNSSSNLEVHKLIHSRERPHVCSVCSKAFETKKNLKSHMRIHSGEKNYKCEVCSKAFYRVDLLIRHMRLHTGEKPYTCEICSKAFVDQANCKNHKRLHTREKPYTCDVCSKAFAQHGNLKTHMRQHTGEKPYTCKVCSKAFADQANCNKHMRQHTGEKPYTCDVCSKAFTQHGQLKGHLRPHRGEALCL